MDLKKNDKVFINEKGKDYLKDYHLGSKGVFVVIETYMNRGSNMVARACLTNTSDPNWGQFQGGRLNGKVVKSLWLPYRCIENDENQISLHDLNKSFA